MGTLTLVITCIAGVLVLFGFIGGLRRGSGRTLYCCCDECTSQKSGEAVGGHGS